MFLQLTGQAHHLPPSLLILSPYWLWLLPVLQGFDWLRGCLGWEQWWLAIGS